MYFQLFFVFSLLSISTSFLIKSSRNIYQNHNILATNNYNKNNLKMVNSFYEIFEKDGKGNDVSFEKFRGKVVYGVNVASRCGYTQSGYALLSRIAALKDRGVEVAIFPCNQFGAQEPGSDEEVASFCAMKGVKDANLFTKADVNGPGTRPTYTYLKEKGVLGDISWNFAGKFIIDKEGNAYPVKSEKSLESDILALAEK